MLRTLKIGLIGLFALCISFLLISITSKTAGYSREFVKSELKNSGVYGDILALLKENVQEGLADEDGKQSELKIVDQFIDEFDSSYLELKANKLIDDSAVWISGETNSPPVISFADLKEKLLKKNPEIIEALSEMGKESQKNVAEGEGIDRGESLAAENEAAQSFSQLLTNDPEIKVAGILAPVKGIYKSYQIGFYLSIIVAAIALILIVVLSTPDKAKYLWLGWTFAVCSLMNGVGLGLIWLINKSDPLPLLLSAIGTEIRSNEYAEKFNLVVHTLSNPWIMNYFKIQTFGLVLLLVLSIVFFISAYRITTQPAITPSKKSR